MYSSGNAEGVGLEISFDSAVLVLVLVELASYIKVSLTMWKSLNHQT